MDTSAFMEKCRFGTIFLLLKKGGFDRIFSVSLRGVKKNREKSPNENRKNHRMKLGKITEF
jgi:hypothetical protein